MVESSHTFSSCGTNAAADTMRMSRAVFAPNLSGETVRFWTGLTTLGATTFALPRDGEDVALPLTFTSTVPVDPETTSPEGRITTVPTGEGRGARPTVRV